MVHLYLHFNQTLTTRIPRNYQTVISSFNTISIYLLYIVGFVQGWGRQMGYRRIKVSFCLCLWFWSQRIIAILKILNYKSATFFFSSFQIQYHPCVAKFPSAKSNL